jgi:hypothetical protein
MRCVIVFISLILSVGADSILDVARHNNGTQVANMMQAAGLESLLQGRGMVDVIGVNTKSTRVGSHTQSNTHEIARARTHLHTYTHTRTHTHKAKLHRLDYIRGVVPMSQHLKLCQIFTDF